jgi:hypothetical protein
MDLVNLGPYEDPAYLSRYNGLPNPPKLAQYGPSSSTNSKVGLRNLGYPDRTEAKPVCSSFTWRTHAAVLAGVTCHGLPRNGRDARRGGRGRHLRSLVNSLDLSFSRCLWPRMLRANTQTAPPHSSPISHTASSVNLFYRPGRSWQCARLHSVSGSLPSEVKTEFYMRSLQEPPILRGPRD